MTYIGRTRLRRISISGGIGLPVYLSRMAPPDKYNINRLPLYKLARVGEKTRFVITRFLLMGTLECKDKGKFFFKMRADFGENPPSSAKIMVKETQHSVTLVRNGAPVQTAGLPFGIPPGKDKVVFQITAWGSDETPETFYAALRNAKPETIDDDEPPTPHGLPVP